MDIVLNCSIFFRSCKILFGLVKFKTAPDRMSGNVWEVFVNTGNDLDLQYSHTFINSISCLHLPTFRSQAAIVSEKSTVFTFPHRKA